MRYWNRKPASHDVAPEGHALSVGDVVRLLHSEFPDVSASSLRFLEQEGLVRPARSAGRQRLYRDEDVARIRLIKRLQSRRRYPLSEIRRMLGKLERATDVEAEIAFLESLHTPVSYDPAFVPLSADRLAAQTRLSPSAVARLTRMRLLLPQRDERGGQRFDEDDLAVARLVAAELGRGARLADFAPYAGAMRALVEEEFRLFLKLSGSLEPTVERARQLKEEADLVHTLLRAKLTRALLLRERANVRRSAR